MPKKEAGASISARSPHKWNREDDKSLLIWRAEGKTDKEIAAITSFTPTQLACRRHRLHTDPSRQDYLLELKGEIARELSQTAGNEEWRTIPEWPAYETSSDGRIRHEDRRRQLKAHCNHGGYPMVSLYRDGKGTTTAVHRIVAMTFLGERPTGYTINHKDGNKLNNSVENLEFVTLKENREHAIRLGLWGFGERNGNSKLTKDQVIRIRELYGTMPHYKLARLFGIQKSTTMAIGKRKIWKHIP
jgi:hypothetical protein